MFLPQTTHKQTFKIPDNTFAPTFKIHCSDLWAWGGVGGVKICLPRKAYFPGTPDYTLLRPCHTIRICHLSIASWVCFMACVRWPHTSSCQYNLSELTKNIAPVSSRREVPLFQEEWQVTCVYLSPGFLDLCILQFTGTHSILKYHGSSWWI